MQLRMYWFMLWFIRALKSEVCPSLLQHWRALTHLWNLFTTNSVQPVSTTSTERCTMWLISFKIYLRSHFLWFYWKFLFIFNTKAPFCGNYVCLDYVEISFLFEVFILSVCLFQDLQFSVRRFFCLVEHSANDIVLCFFSSSSLRAWNIMNELNTEKELVAKLVWLKLQYVMQVEMLGTMNSSTKQHRRYVRWCLVRAMYLSTSDASCLAWESYNKLRTNGVKESLKDSGSITSASCWRRITYN